MVAKDMWMNRSGTDDQLDSAYTGELTLPFRAYITDIGCFADTLEIMDQVRSELAKSDAYSSPEVQSGSTSDEPFEPEPGDKSPQPESDVFGGNSSFPKNPSQIRAKL